MTPRNLPRGFIIALQFLTRLPTPRLADFETSDLARAAPFVPLVGLVVGGIVAATAWGGAHVSPWIGALAGLLAWVAVTGAVHLDGLGDVADALGASHRDPERFLIVLADPHAGSFAVVSIAMQIAAKLVLLAALPLLQKPDVVIPALALVAAWARWGALAWSGWLPSLKAGLGRGFGGGGGRVGVIAAWAVALALASLGVAPMLLAALPAVALIGLYWRWRLGGITGDCLGAGIEVTESLLLLALAVAAQLGRPWL